MFAKRRHVSVFVAVDIMHMFSYRFILCVTSMFSSPFLSGEIKRQPLKHQHFMFNQQPSYVCVSVV